MQSETKKKLHMSIHDVSEYVNFHYKFNFVLTIVFSSYALIVATIFVVLRMSHVYYRKKKTPSSTYIHKSLFKSFVWMEIANFFFLLFDNLVFGLPSTGILTSFCASIEPNHLLKVFYMLQLLSNYCSMFYSLLFCVTRLLIVSYPDKHERYCLVLYKVFVPCSLLLPICFDFFMLPSLGYCRQLIAPFPTGSVFISFSDTWFGLRTDPFHLPVSLLIPAIITLINVLLVFRIRKTIVASRTLHSPYSYKSEISLTSTTIAIIAPFLANATMTFVSDHFRDFSSYVLLVRCPIVASGMALVPWIFFLSHPLFSRKSQVMPATSS